ncbi:MFS transporter [Bradyrhizobium guangdongense]|uniref:MFS transporter n=1 Tax=Bradyrhizobium guangdongense TaxID=1325090 RepID=A0A410VH56_9BRAD|nr:MFS transporter [Bradyrhizobium guangdongense]QAU42984.1 MFS transporter [Bradyrhizobium guangdongense]QOZ64039.1 MFS transporter [Bradyrhizobium guangdongense]GGI26261.1 MFS transporter [Bradyrhizobium guangdongense]
MTIGAFEDGGDHAAVCAGQTASSRRRVLIAGTIGTAIEWYDFFIYGLIAPLLFDQLFFPKFDQLAASIAVFATFAVGFLARPLGGLVFGHFGDRLGRKSVLLCTLLMMGLATMSIGLLPTYANAGVAATIALVALRFLQGFALGGESTAAILMAIETAPGHRRGFSAAVIQAAGPVGVVLASFAALAISRLPEADLLSWGWRVPFLISAVLVALGVYMRLRIEESATFREAVESEAVPAVEAIRGHWRPILIVFFAEMAQTSYFYLTAIFTISFATRQLGVQKDVITQAVLFANLVGLVTMPLIGAWSDRIGRKRLFLTGVVLAAVSMFAFYGLVASRDTVLITSAVVLAAGIIHPLMFSTEGSYFPELFPTRIRFTGVSIGKQLGTVLGGGIAPLVATSLFAQTGTTYAITGYYVALALAAMIALGFAHETSKSRLLG